MHSRSTAITRRPTREQADVLCARAQLATQREKLAAREADLSHLRDQLASFKARYIRQVGVLYVQLDDWEDRIAQLNGGAPPPVPPPAESSAPPEPQAPLDLKALFREVAKRIHPDFARNRLDAQHRTRLMAQANDAYNRNDPAVLQRMLNGYDPAAEPNGLALVQAQIEQAVLDIAAIDAEIDALAQSEMAQLQARSIQAATKGQDLLADLAGRVKARISLAMRRYEFDVARIKRKQAPFDPTSLLSAETDEAR